MPRGQHANGHPRHTDRGRTCRLAIAGRHIYRPSAGFGKSAKPVVELDTFRFAFSSAGLFSLVGHVPPGCFAIWVAKATNRFRPRTSPNWAQPKCSSPKGDAVILGACMLSTPLLESMLIFVLEILSKNP